MAPMLKRRKILDGPSARVSTIKPIKPISTFAKVSKASAIRVKHEKEDAFDSDDDRKHKPAFRVKPSKKRQREDEPEEGLREQSGNIVSVVIDQDLLKTPRKKVRFAASEEGTQTPTRGGRSLLESFVISGPRKVLEVFDENIQDLIELNAAFLNALAIHYAHNGTASPIDLKELIPQIESKWGKRRINTEDIRRILGVQHSNKRTALSLVQRSAFRICIEYNSEVKNALPVETLKREFVEAIRRTQHTELPLEEIKIHTPVENIFFGKGAQRLQEIKAAAIQAQPVTTITKPVTQHTPGTTSTRATSLLDRIRTKETLLSTLPAAPTPEALARKASLQRLEEIIPILEVLSGSSSSVSGRSLYNSTTSLASLSSLGSSLGLGPAPPAKVVSFTMGTVVQQLQNSMRHPIAKEEVERAIRLLAVEVAPRWVSVRDVGSVLGVTFRGKMGRAEWSARLKTLLLQT